LSAAQALDFRRPAKSSESIEKLVATLREKVSFVAEDRFMHPDMVTATQIIASYAL
jgi:histidine ammonia-lyase